MHEFQFPLEVVTPLGVAICIGIWDDGDNPQWITFIKSTGEPWFWRNQHIRLRPTVTSTRNRISPFGNITDALQVEIKRYKENDWL